MKYSHFSKWLQRNELNWANFFVNFAVANATWKFYPSWRMILWSLYRKRCINWLCLLFLIELWNFCSMYAALSLKPSVMFLKLFCDSGDRWEWGWGNKAITLVSGESCLAVKFFSPAVEEKPNTWEVRDAVSVYAVTFE